MTIVDINLPDAGRTSPTGVPPAKPNPLPPDCDPDRYLNWRLKTAMYLVDHADGSPIAHDDRWIKAMVDFRIASQLQNRMPTQTDLAICAATELWQSDTLAKHLLEARLLAQETPDEISARCALSPLTVTAYSKIHFDVCGTTRKGIWLMRPFGSTTVAVTEMSKFGWRLKQIACFSSSQELEGYIGTLQRIEGKTLADGCSVRGDLNSVQQIVPRLAVARMLLSMSPSAERQLNRFQEAATSEVRAGRTTVDSFDLAISVLRNVKVPARLQRELRSMREGLAATQDVHDAPNA